MFKYTKRLISDIRFWCWELRLRGKENAELERIKDDAFSGLGHPMAGYGYYPMKRNRAERKQLHLKHRATIK